MKSGEYEILLGIKMAKELGVDVHTFKEAQVVKRNYQKLRAHKMADNGIQSKLHPLFDPVSLKVDGTDRTVACDGVIVSNARWKSDFLQNRGQSLYDVIPSMEVGMELDLRNDELQQKLLPATKRALDLDPDTDNHKPRALKMFSKAQTNPDALAKSVHRQTTQTFGKKLVKTCRKAIVDGKRIRPSIYSFDWNEASTYASDLRSTKYQ
jgi:hypothetical protein